MQRLPDTPIPTYLVESQASANAHLADELSALLKERPRDLILGLATGSSPVGLYAELVRRFEEDWIDFSFVKTFNLDEYRGLPSGHPTSYRTFMAEHLFSKVNLGPRNTHLPPTKAEDLDAACQAWEEEIQATGGIDWQLLGVGRNGHIGFNEPGSAFDSRTRKVELAESTREANARFFDSGDEVPTEAVTMGIGTILEAKRVRVLAFGPTKADVLARVLRGEDDESIPLNALRRHPDAALFIDEAAAAGLRG
ncbi:MAG: glucosamine-6-phosphate deaminase [Planctomycetes bacterium]|nr:glucosamine-6-phosphate deaminase [Planctomycetota bacterium]